MTNRIITKPQALEEIADKIDAAFISQVLPLFDDLRDLYHIDSTEISVPRERLGMFTHIDKALEESVKARNFMLLAVIQVRLAAQEFD